MSDRAARLCGMKTTEFWYWMMTDEWGRRRKSPCRYTAADALARDPTATPIEGSCVLIDVAETDDERYARAPHSPPRPR